VAIDPEVTECSERCLEAHGVADADDSGGVEQDLRDQLADREVLLAELDHRLKNIMMMIAGFLALQARRAESPETRAALHDVMLRVQGLERAQQALLKLGAWERVDLRPFLAEVVGQLILLEGRPEVRFEAFGTSLECSVAQASALGLVVNELATNSLKHAFPKGGGLLTLEVRQEPGGRGVVIIADNGVGWGGQPTRHDRGIGLRLIEALSRHAGAKITLTSDAGARAVLEFPVE
jgi:two-component sensor histidine kinase